MLNLKATELKDEVIINRENSNEQIRLFLGNPQMPGIQVQLNLDLSGIYKVSRVPINDSNDVYTPYLIRGGGDPLIICRKNPLWTSVLYERGISNLVLDSEELLILHLGKKGKIGREIQINVFAPNFETLEYEVLQDPNALRHQEVRKLRNIVDHKILKRLRGAA